MMTSPPTRRWTRATAAWRSAPSRPLPHRVGDDQRLGDYVIAFSTHPQVRAAPGRPADPRRPAERRDVAALLPLPATEEAIYNSLFKATTSAAAASPSRRSHRPQRWTAAPVRRAEPGPHAAAAEVSGRDRRPAPGRASARRKTIIARRGAPRQVSGEAFAPRPAGAPPLAPPPSASHSAETHHQEAHHGYKRLGLSRGLWNNADRVLRLCRAAGAPAADRAAMGGGHDGRRGASIQAAATGPGGARRGGPIRALLERQRPSAPRPSRTSTRQRGAGAGEGAEREVGERTVNLPAGAGSIHVPTSRPASSRRCGAWPPRWTRQITQLDGAHLPAWRRCASLAGLSGLLASAAAGWTAPGSCSRSRRRLKAIAA